MKLMTLVLVSAFVLGGLTGCHMFSDVDASGPPCVCEMAADAPAMWCEKCSEGFVDGKMVTKCAGCYAAKQGGPACEACTKQ